MSDLRIFGLIIGIFGLYLTFRIFRGSKWKRLNFLFFGIINLFLVVISIYPDLLNIVTGILALEDEHRGRILTVLIFSNIFLWFLLLYFKARLDEYRYQFDLLIRNLGREETKQILEKEIMVVIPAYNEAENLREVLRTMPSQINDKKIGVLVIDDGSVDNTADVVRQFGYSVVRNKINRGGGAALRAAYDILKDSKSYICVTMDADGQHNPQEIKILVRPILKNRYDFVIGSRILGKHEKDNWFRFVGLHIFNFIINLLLGVKITDCSSGFRAFKVDLLKSVVLKEDQYYTSEFIIDIVKKGFRIGEVPVTFLKRKYGESKKGKDWKYGLNFAKTILKAWWR